MLARLLLLLGVFGCTNAQFDPNCDGKQVIVELFQWKWTDIAAECKRFLGPMGYCGVQISPPNEHIVIKSPEADRPWWERYQPISYKLKSRSGTEEELKDMIATCNDAGVRIYADAVLNHMARLNTNGTGIAGSRFDSSDYDYPGVPYSKPNFHSRADCPSTGGNVTNSDDPREVRNCNFLGLTDLDQSQEYVRQKQVAYLNHLIDLGVAGFRLDASKYMWPDDLKAIINATKTLNAKWFKSGARPFYIHDVMDDNKGAVKTQEYEELGLVTEFRYSQNLASGSEDFLKLNGIVDYGWGMEKPDRALVFVDNHDVQRGVGLWVGKEFVTFKNPREYKKAAAFMLANDYGFPRVMSSYHFTLDAEGPPHASDFTVRDVQIDADGSCGNGWVCEHRWKPIANMVKFRNAVVGTRKSKWRIEKNFVSFSRTRKGFFAMARSGNVDTTFDTGLPVGEYCDVIHDCAQKITVDQSGHARIVITNHAEPVVAFYLGAHNVGAQTAGQTSSTSDPVTSTPGTSAHVTSTPNTPSVGNTNPGISSTENTATSTTEPVTTAPGTSTTDITTNHTTTPETTTNGTPTPGSTTLGLTTPETTTNGTPTPGSTTLGLTTPETTTNGTPTPGSTTLGLTTPETTTNGTPTPGSTTLGLTTPETTTNGTPTPGSTTLGLTTPEITTNGTPTPGSTTLGLTTPETTTNGTPTPGSTTLGLTTPETTTNGMETHVNTANGTTTPGSSTNATATPGSTTLGSTNSGNTTNSTTTPGNTTNSTTTPGNTTNGMTTPGSNTSGPATPETTTNGMAMLGSTTNGTAMPGNTTNVTTMPGSTTPGLTTSATITNGTTTPGSAGNATITLGNTTDGTIISGSTGNGTAMPGSTANGTTTPGSTTTGRTTPRTTTNGTTRPGTTVYANTTLGRTTSDMTTPGTTTNGTSTPGTTANGTSTHGTTTNGKSTPEPATNGTITSGTTTAASTIQGSTTSSSSSAQITTPQTTTSGITGNWKRTVIFVYRPTQVGEDVFIGGGIDHSRKTGCVDDAANSPCAIPIKHRHMSETGHYPKFEAWKKGDNFLDWYGSEPGQGSYNAQEAMGTPALWTTNDHRDPSYDQLNKYGEHYWMVDVDMDCSRTINDWFELKSIVDGHWESPLGSNSGGVCTGTAGGSRPFASKNHEARCGFVNVFKFDSNFCEINYLDN